MVEVGRLGICALLVEDKELSDRAKLAYCIYLAELYLAGELDLDALWEKSTERCVWLNSEPNELAGPLVGFMDGSVWAVREDVLREADFRRELAGKLAEAGWRPQSGEVITDSVSIVIPATSAEDVWEARTECLTTLMGIPVVYLRGTGA